jgi:hypothetical protein
MMSASEMSRKTGNQWPFRFGKTPAISREFAAWIDGIALLRNARVWTRVTTALKRNFV